MNKRYVEHPFVALPGLSVFSPEPNQLRIQDLRGVECYPQPDRLEVCGAADTTCILLFTKSAERLPDIRLTLRFGEGIEYGGFAEVNYSDDAVFPPPLTDVNVISDQNPEAPSFLISEVTRDSGAVYVCFGIRAECGSDIEEFPPIITYDWAYTTEAGVFCKGEYTAPESFGSEVIIPRVQFAPNAVSDANLDGPNDLACQTVRITQSTPGTSVSGYLITVDEYGFDDGIALEEIRFDGGTLARGEDFTVDPTGLVTANINKADNPLAFNGIDEITLCYTYTDCPPNIDFRPLYTVVSTCEGEICTGPPEANDSGRLISRFTGVADINIDYDTGEVAADDTQFPSGGLPNACSDEPYVFDITVAATNGTPVEGDIYDVRLRLRACASSLFFLSQVQLVDEDGSVLAIVPEAGYSVRTTDRQGTASQQLDVAGTVSLDLRDLEMAVGPLLDLDGDGSFNDLPAGEVIRIRFFYELHCGIEDAENTFVAAEGSFMGCQFSDITAFGRSACDSAGEDDREQNVPAPDFSSSSTAEFQMLTPFPGNQSSFSGYDFGRFGETGGQAMAPSTETISFSYALQSNPATDCATPQNATAIYNFTLPVKPLIANNIEFTNVRYDGAPVAAADITIDRSTDGIVILSVRGPVGSGAGDGTTRNFTFTATIDEPGCDPPLLTFASATINTMCDAAEMCDCNPAAISRTLPLRFDPQQSGCDCYNRVEVQARRTSVGFTDETRTTRAPIPGFNAVDDDALRFLPGDTLEIRYAFSINPNGTSSPAFDAELGGGNDRTLQFIMESRYEAAGLLTDQYPNLFDYPATRVLSFTIKRGDDGSVINLGEVLSGGVTQQPIGPGIYIGLPPAASRPTTVADWYQEGEIEQPAFPDGGYIFGGGDTGNAELDGNVFALSLTNDIYNRGSTYALDEFYDAIGEWRDRDTVFITWQLVTIENPGQTGQPIALAMRPRFRGERYVSREANLFTGYATTCQRNSTFFEYYSPTVQGSAEINYSNDCEGEAVYTFTNDELLPDGWYEDEFRPINGLEELVAEIPYPYYYTGGGTYESVYLAEGPQALDVAATSMFDSAMIDGEMAYAPTAGGENTGTLIFRDAEFADGVREYGYANIDFEDDDVSTVGGTFPLIAVTNLDGVRDSLVLRLPLRRLCSDGPTPALTATYSWANKYLPNYFGLPWQRNGNATNQNFWNGKVQQNDGTPLTNDAGDRIDFGTLEGAEWYFPFFRLPGKDGSFDEADPQNLINPHRRIGRMETYTISGQPDVLGATLTQDPSGQLIDVDGQPETKTITITPDGGQELSGAVLVSITEGGRLEDILIGGAPVATQRTEQDTNTIFSFPIPDGLGIDGVLTFDVVTDLLFCAAVEVCITPILGCSDDVDLVTAASLAFDPMCASTMTNCYQYDAGAVSIGTTLSEPAKIGLCETQTFTIQYFNDGTSNLANFSPVLYLPEGLAVSNFRAVATGGTEQAVANPMADPTTDAVFGTGAVFAQAELNAVFANANGGDAAFLANQILTITFDGQTGCGITSGVPLVSVARGDAACNINYAGPESFSQNIDIAIDEPQPTTLFSFNVDEQPLAVSCSDDGDRLIVTAANVGKAGATESQICARLPAGVDLDLANIIAISPDGFSVNEDDIVVTSINDSGDREICFDAPTLAAGGFICLEIPFIIGDLPCGPVFIGATVITQAEVACANLGPGDTDPCVIDVSTTEMGYFELDVVPAVTTNEAELTTSCTGTPGVFDVDYNFEFVAESRPYSGEVNIQLYSDVDANGEFDPGIDTQIGTAQTTQVNLARDETKLFSGTFPGVGQDEICPLLFVIESLGCTCNQSVQSFPDVLPDFVDQLGDNVALCPGEGFTFDDICADLNYAFEDPAAGVVLIDEGTGEATISLNDGFGVNAPEVLIVTGNFGNCSLEHRIGVSTVPDLDFGPYRYSVCNVGSQEVDLNIPLALQEDISVEILDPVGIENPDCFEPRISGLTEDRTYQVAFTFNEGQCMGVSTLDVVVEQAVEITLNDLTACQNGFRLDDRLTVVPSTAMGTFQSDGDGAFTPGSVIPGEVRYTPGPMDVAAGFVNIRFKTAERDGPCGPSVDRVVATLQLVDCGRFYWDGANRD